MKDKTKLEKLKEERDEAKKLFVKVSAWFTKTILEMDRDIRHQEEINKLEQ